MNNKKLLRIGAAVATTLLALALLWQFRIILVYLLLSLALAAALRPMVNRVVGKPPLSRWTWIAIYVLGVTGLGVFFFFTAVQAVDEVQDLVQVVSEQQEWGLPVGPENGSYLATLVSRLPTPSLLYSIIVAELQAAVLPRILGLTQGVVGIITGLTITVFLSIYWIASQDHFERLWLSVLPSGRRTRARRIWRSVELAFGSYIRSQVSQSLFFGVFLGLGFWALGSRFPILLAILGAVTRFVPVVGMGLALAATFLVGFLASGRLGLLMFLFLLGILVAERAMVRPRLFVNRWNSPILTLVYLLALAQVMGVLGLLIAPLLGVLTQILWYYLSYRREEPGAVIQVSALRERAQRVRDRIAAMEEPPPPLVVSSLEQLDKLLDRATPILEAAFPDVPPHEEAVPDRQS